MASTRTNRTPKPKLNQIKCKTLTANAGIAADYSKEIIKLISQMSSEIKIEMKDLFQSESLHGTMDGNISSQARIRLNKILDKYNPLFNSWAKRITDRMISRTIKNSAITLGMSLREVSQDLSIDFSKVDNRLRNVITASTEEAANLIKLIPEKYLADVQGAVMRSITTGNGLKDLIPFMNTKYAMNKRHARNVAIDQTRKSYNNINATRMEAIGQTKFEWIHSGGGMHPRKLHQELAGKEYDLKDPPVIGVMYGEEVRGIPGQLPNCGCSMRPIISFG
jgi:uncharacterized protein with gpF-like domain